MEASSQLPGIYFSDFRLKSQKKGGCFSSEPKEMEIKDLIHPMLIQEKFKERSLQIDRLSSSIKEIKEVPDYMQDYELLLAVHEDYDIILKYIGELGILKDNLTAAEPRHEILTFCTDESLKNLRLKYEAEKKEFLGEFKKEQNKKNGTSQGSEETNEKELTSANEKEKDESIFV